MCICAKGCVLVSSIFMGWWHKKRVASTLGCYLCDLLLLLMHAATATAAASASASSQPRKHRRRPCRPHGGV